MGQQHHHRCRRSRIKTKNVLHPNQIIAKSDLLSLRIPLVETNGAIIFHIRSSTTSTQQKHNFVNSITSTLYI